MGGEVLPATREQFGVLIRVERLPYEKRVREANIKPDLILIHIKGIHGIYQNSWLA